MSFACATWCRTRCTRRARGRLLLRRAPHPEFHSCSTPTCASCGATPFTTSSLAAARVLDGMPLIGTWAHEGVMAFHRPARSTRARPSRRSRWRCSARRATTRSSLTRADRRRQAHARRRRPARRRGLARRTRDARAPCRRVGRGPAADGVEDRGLGDIAGAGARVQVLRRRRLLRQLARQESSLAAKITKALKPWTSTAEFGTLRPGWAGKLGDYPRLGAASTPATRRRAKARAKFIVALDAPDRDRSSRSCATGAQGRRAPTPAAAAIEQRSDAEALAKEFRDRHRAGDGALRRDQVRCRQPSRRAGAPRCALSVRLCEYPISIGMNCYTVSWTFFVVCAARNERWNAGRAPRGHAAVELRVLRDPPRHSAAAHAVAESQWSQVARLYPRRLAPRGLPSRRRAAASSAASRNPRGERGATEAAAGQNLDRRVVRRQIRRRAPRGREARQPAARRPKPRFPMYVACPRKAAPSNAEPHVTFWRCALPRRELGRGQLRGEGP